MALAKESVGRTESDEYVYVLTTALERILQGSRNDGKVTLAGLMAQRKP